MSEAVGASFRVGPRVDLALVAFVAFAIRITHAWFVSATPFFEGLVIDAYSYRTWAERLAETGDFGGPFYQPPLYPAFLALLIRSGLGSAWSVAAVQSALGAATAALMLLAGRKLACEASSARKTGLATGMVVALYGPFVFFDVEVLPPVLVLALLAAALVLSFRTGPPGVVDALIGLALGLAIVGWPLSIVMAVGVLALRARRIPRRYPWALGVLLALFFAMPPLFLTAQHNAVSGGRGVVISFNSGVNLWLGNNPAWRDTWRARPGARFEPELERPDRAGITQPAERSAFFVRQVLRDVAERPGAALARSAEKFYYVWHGREIRRNQDIALIRSLSPILGTLLWEAGVCFPFGILAPLALLGIWRRRNEPDIRILGVTLLLYAAGIAVFFVAARYRLPLALLLIPLAVDQALHLLALGRGALKSVASLAALIVVLNLPNEFTRSFAADGAERGIVEAHAWRNQGKIGPADRLAEKLVARFPDHANVRMLKAELLVNSGRCEQARSHLQRVTELAPRAATPWVMLGSCLDQLDDHDAAERAYAMALALHPYHSRALKLVGAMYARRGRSFEAQAVFKRFLKSGYQDPDVDQWLKELTATERRP